MNQPNLNWFYFHIVLALIIIVKDYNVTLDESLNNFEKKIGLYTPPDTIDSTPPYYIPPIQDIDDEESRIDSNFANTK